MILTGKLRCGTCAGQPEPPDSASALTPSRRGFHHAGCLPNPEVKSSSPDCAAVPASTPCNAAVHEDGIMHSVKFYGPVLAAFVMAFVMAACKAPPPPPP